MSTPRPVHVEPRDGYTLWVKFENGAEGLLDMAEDVREDHWTMHPLRDLDTFRRAQLTSTGPRWFGAASTRSESRTWTASTSARTRSTTGWS